MAIGTSTLIAAGLGIAGGIGVSMLMNQDKGSDMPQSQMPQAPKAPKIEDAQAKADARLTERQKAAARSTSVKTNPLGIKDEAEVARKKLLGG